MPRAIREVWPFNIGTVQQLSERALLSKEGTSAFVITGTTAPSPIEPKKVVCGEKRGMVR